MPKQPTKKNTAESQGTHPHKIDPKTGKLTGNGKYTYQKTTAYDKKALALLKEDPTLTVNQIGNKLVDLGKAQSTRHIYDRLKKSDILRESFAAVEKFHLEQLTRDIYPAASKRWLKALKDKDLSVKEVTPLIKLAADKQFGETHKHVTQQTISIGHLEKMRVLINTDLNSTIKDAQKST